MTKQKMISLSKRIGSWLQSEACSYWHYMKRLKLPLILFIGGILLVLAIKTIPFLFMNFSPPPVAVSASQVQSENWLKKLPALGTVEALHAVTISPEVGGVVSDILFESGHQVEAGQILIRLNDDAEQAELNRYKAQLNLARVALERSQKLTKSRATSAAELDQKEAQQDEAKALVQQAESIIRKKNLTAPFPGVLGIRQVNLGQYLQPGTSIVTLTDASKVYVNFTRPESDRAALSVGQTVHVQVDAYPGRVFEGTLTSIDPKIDRHTRTISLQATFDNTEAFLTPGMFAEVTIILPQPDTFLVIPETAVDFSLHGSSVFLIHQTDAEGHHIPIKILPDAQLENVSDAPLSVMRVYVDVVDRQNGLAAIKTGLEPQQYVVSAGQLKLQNGARVIVKQNGDLPISQALPKH